MTPEKRARLAAAGIPVHDDPDEMFDAMEREAGERDSPSPPDGQPAADPFPALVAHLRRWAARHADKFDRAILAAKPGELMFVVIAEDNPDYRSLRDILDRLEGAIHRRSAAGPAQFRACYRERSEYPMPDDAIALDDPAAPAIIADRIRTAEDLRAELERVTKERDVLVAAMAIPAIETYAIDGDSDLGYRQRPSGRWFSVNVREPVVSEIAINTLGVFGSRAEAEADVLAQVREILEAADHE